MHGEGIDILLDSNVYISYQQLSSQTIQALIDYLTKTNSQLILPQVVLDELKGHCKRELTKALKSFHSGSSLSSQWIVDRKSLPVIPDIDIEAESQKYVEHVLKVFKNVKVHKTGFTGVNLEELSNRAIDRRRPFDPNGNGFRDTMIWLQAKYLSTGSKRKLVLISNDGGAFHSPTAPAKDKSSKVEAAASVSLHGDLIKECETEKLNIAFFSSLPEFLKTESVEIGFITEEWLLQELDWTPIKLQVIENLNGRTERLQDIMSESRQHLGDFKVRVGNVMSYTVPQFWVYKKVDGTLIVEVNCSMYVEIECMSFMFDEPDSDPTRGYEVAGLYVPVMLTATVKDKHVIGVDEPKVFLPAGRKKR